MNKNYNIGLDIGTNSVGWAVTDQFNNLLRFNKKNMWGVRLFDSAETAESRRIFRSSRRRLQRRKTRIRLLQEIFNDEILSVDPVFFLRLKESYLTPNDKVDSNEYNLFTDLCFNDKHFYSKFPTIYHLRQYLLNAEEKVDIRLIYLALHHIIKYRGNFLYEGQVFSVNGVDILQSIKELFDLARRFDLTTAVLPLDFEENMLKVLEDKQLSKKQKLENISSMLHVKEKSLEEMFKAILGLQFNLSKLVNNETKIEGTDSLNKLKLSDEKFEETMDQINDKLGDLTEVIEMIQKVYSWFVMQEVLKGEIYLSNAKVKQYDKHKLDLKGLKRLFKRPEFTQAEYKEMFKSKKEKLTNYYNYIKQSKDCNSEELYSYILKILNTKGSVIKDDKDYLYVIHSIEREDFLVKQNNRSNSMIPYQLNELELIQIIERQTKYYDFLEESKTKINQILTFRIPYYVGPLNSSSRFSWVRKNSAEKIYPWNFNEVIDTAASAEAFISRMTNHCTYLIKEKVIPKQSLLYSKFMVLNELNKIRVNGHFLDKQTRSNIMTTLFLKHRKVKESHLVEWLKKNQVVYGSTCKIEGFQGEKCFANGLSPYIDFIRIFGDIKPGMNNMIENIIYWLTIFEDRKIVRQKITTSYPEIEETMLKQILKLRYTGWSRLSHKLLDGIFITTESKEQITIIDHLVNTNDNLMQILNNESLGFKNIIDEECKMEVTDKIDYNIIKELQGSPAIKRGIWQAIQIVNEIRKIMKCDPDKVFIEFAREDQESKRTNSRYNQMLKIYDQLKKDKTLLIDSELFKSFKHYEKQLQSEKVYLYFLQQGKCMYTMEPLSIDSLSSYQVDHIIPQSYIKDDSFDNKVLVKTIKNQEKLNFLLPIQMIPKGKESEIKAWWGKLNEYGLISSKKHYNLLEKEYSEDREKGFIQRQLVETRQISKHVAQLLTQMLDSKIWVIKAELTSNFRKQFDIFKNRNINDFHHAHDALITSIIGNYIHMKFPNMDSEFIYNEFKKFKDNSNKKYKFGFVISSMLHTSVTQDGELIWKEDESIASIKKILNYKDCIVTKKLEEQTGQFYKLQLVKKGKGKIERKKNIAPEKYGGYTGENSAYLVAISHKVGKKYKKELISIPVSMANELSDSETKIIEYLNSSRGLIDAKLLRNKIMKYQLVDCEGEKKYIVALDEQHNATQFVPDKQFDHMLFQVNKSKESLLNQEELNRFFDHYLDKLGSIYPIFNSIHSKLVRTKDRFNLLSIKDKMTVIKELLKIVSAGAQNGNLKLLGLTEREGRIRGKTIKLEKTYFIDQSITGLFQRRVKL